MRDLSRQYQAGGREAFDPFAALASKLLHLTVAQTGSGLHLWRGDNPDTAMLTGLDRIAPVELNDGRYLRVTMSLGLGQKEPRLMRVVASSFQYQRDLEGEDWIFRYDYAREPGPDPHPTAHLQIRGDFRSEDVLPSKNTLERVHFPTGRISIEAVIRLLADEFGVKTNYTPQLWRRVLAESERMFLDIAHTPLSGPAS